MMQRSKIHTLSKTILEGTNLKMPVYNLLITLSQERALKKLKTQNSNKKPITITGKKIIFNCVHGTYLEAIYKEAAIAKALQLRGNDVKMITCGGVFNYCTGLFTVGTPPNKTLCKNCKSFSKRFFNIIDLPHSNYKDYLKNSSLITIPATKSIANLENFKHEGIRVGFHAKNSTQRFFIGKTNIDKTTYKTIFMQKLFDAVLSVEVAKKVLELEKPDILVTSHDCYAEWGSFTEYFKNHNIKVHVWMAGYKGETVTFDYNKIGENFDANKQLTLEEDFLIQNFLEKRIHGKKGGGDTFFYHFSKDINNLEDIYHFSKFDKTYMMFPSIPWDFSLVDANRVFKDVYEWVDFTIEEFKKKPNLQLIIKIHPADYLRSKETMLDYINANHKTLPNNIQVISPTTTISPYSLFPHTDVALIYYGTEGLEAALEDIPTVVVGNSHYSNKGFTYDVQTKEEYQKIIFDDLLPLKNQKEIAYRYAYYFFIKSFVPLRFLYYNNFLDLGWNIKSTDEFKEGCDSYLDHICKYVTSHKNYQAWEISE